MKLPQDKYEFSTMLVSKCLTERCQECTGLYVPSIDRMRAQIICFCICHKKRDPRQLPRSASSLNSQVRHKDGEHLDDYN
jgi:hypothetical protein